MTFALLERVIDTAQRLGLHLNPREQSILIATLRGDSRRAIAQEMSITPQEVSRQADAALQQLTLFLNRMATDEDRQAQQTGRRGTNSPPSRRPVGCSTGISSSPWQPHHSAGAGR